MKKSSWIIFVLLPLGFSLSAFETQKENVKLEVNEDSGRYNVRYAESLAEGDFVPFFVPEDIWTTKDILILGGRRFVLGDEGGFKTEVLPQSTGARILWSRSDFSVQKTIEIFSSSESQSGSGVKITYTLTNTGASNTRAQIGILLDTYLGEQGVHFYTSDGQAITAEREIESFEMPESIVSRKRDESAGLRVMTLGSQLSSPQRIVLANWRRINDSKGDFDIKEGRDFNQLPYSINDSAIYLEYPTTVLRTQQTAKLVVAIGSWSAPALDITNLAEDSDQLDELLTATVNDADLSPAQLYQQDMDALIALLNELNDKLKQPQLFTEDDQQLYEATLKEIESRRNIYLRE
jgi:hypothetical protein